MSQVKDPSLLHLLLHSCNSRRHYFLSTCHSRQHYFLSTCQSRRHYFLSTCHSRRHYFLCTCHSRRHDIILFKTTHKKVIKSLLAEALFLTCDEFTLTLDYVFDVKFNFLWWIEMIICSGWYSINCLLLETGGSNGTVSSSNPHTYWDVLLLLLLRALLLWKECVLCVCFILDINHFWDKQ